MIVNTSMCGKQLFPNKENSKNFRFLSSRDHFAGVFRAVSTFASERDQKNSFLESIADEKSKFSSENRVPVEVCGSCRVE